MNTIESFYDTNVLPAYGMTAAVQWISHVQTDPDSFVHVFESDGRMYALAFEDYPGDFSILRDASVRRMKTREGEEVFSMHDGATYKENMTGYFMLFEVRDEQAFKIMIEYLQAQYLLEKEKWHSESRTLVAISRDVLQLLETAAKNSDANSLYAMQNILQAFELLDAKDNNVSFDTLHTYAKILLDERFGYETYSPEDKEAAKSELYKDLSVNENNALAIQKYKADHLNATVQFVTAMYARVTEEDTRGISVALIVRGGKIDFLSDHFMNEKLREYFAQHSMVTTGYLADDMPEYLGEYRLVAGSITVQQVFEEELKYISL